MWEHLRAAWGLRGDLAGATAISFTRKLLRVCLALGHARQYQEDHADGLRQDWARVPIPRDRALFDALAQAGEHVATLLDPLAPARSVIAATIKEAVRSLAVLSRRGGGAVRKSDLVITASYFGAAPGRWVGREYEDGEPEIDALGDSTGDLFLNDEVFFRNVPDTIWRFELGGYPILKKWLGYRDEKRTSGRPLSLAEKDHFREMVHRLAALLVLRPKLDELYEQAAADSFTAEELGLVQ
jgi:hypothetical protein